jgi:hypothetical protein
LSAINACPLFRGSPPCALPVDKRIDTGVVVVTKENLADPANAELLRPPLEKYLK